MILHETFQMSNGIRIPKIALGTWQVSEEQAKTAVLSAVKLGYRHIDTAAAYRNEKGVGEALKACGVNRNELYITSKVPAELKTYEEAKRSIEDSISYIGSEIDLMLIHAPKPWSEMAGDGYRYPEENLAVWRAMEEAQKEGKLRSIGVSNFNEGDLQNILAHAEIKPVVNQICVHIGNVPQALIAYCKQQNILVEAYSPNATGRLPGNENVREMAKKYGVSVPQLGIRFCLQLGLLPLPKTVHEEYMRQNAEVDFEISSEDMNALLAL